MYLIKYLLIIFCLAAFSSATAYAQVSDLQRNSSGRLLGNDSMHINYNQDYFVVVDSCAEILRLARFNVTTSKFFGDFKDVNKNNAAQLIAKGSYNQNGLKDGPFICYYTNEN